MPPEANAFPKTWVFLRGLTRASFHWLGFQNRFKEALQIKEIFSPDLAGNGSLYDRRSNTQIDDAVEQVRSLVSIKPEEKIGICAISMGGMIAARWAEMYPTEVSHLVLINSSFATLSPFYERLRPGNYLGLVGILIFSSAERIERFILNVTSNFEDKWKPHLEDFVEFHKKHPVSGTNFLRQLKMASQSGIKKKLAAKVLILSSLKDRLVNLKCSQQIAEHWSAPIEIHPNAGHDLPLDDPDWIIEKVMKSF